jgi:hypothetical protein
MSLSKPTYSLGQGLRANPPLSFADARASKLSFDEIMDLYLRHSVQTFAWVIRFNYSRGREVQFVQVGMIVGVSEERGQILFQPTAESDAIIIKREPRVDADNCYWLYKIDCNLRQTPEVQHILAHGAPQSMVRLSPRHPSYLGNVPETDVWRPPVWFNNRYQYDLADAMGFAAHAGTQVSLTVAGRNYRVTLRDLVDDLQGTIRDANAVPNRALFRADRELEETAMALAIARGRRPADGGHPAGN